MTYHVRKLHYIIQSIIPVGWLAIVAWLMIRQGKDVESLLLVTTIAVAFLLIFIYSFIKQAKTPLVVTDEFGILVQNVWRTPEKVTWDLIMHVKKYPVLGYKLETLGRGIWLPLGMLTSDDAQRLLQEIQEKVNINS